MNGPVRAVRGWKLWEEPPPVLRLVLLIYAGWLTVFFGALWSAGGFPPFDVWFAVFVIVGGLLNGAAPAIIGFTPTTGPKYKEPDEVWQSAATIALPGVYGMLFYASRLLLYAGARLLKNRPRTPLLDSLPHRTALNGAAVGLGVFFGHELFVWAAGGSGLGLRWVAAAMAGVAAASLIQSFLIMAVVAVASGMTYTHWLRVDLKDRLATGVDGGLGILVAAAHSVFPWSALFLLPFVNEIERASQQESLLDAGRLDGKTGLANSEFWRQAADGHVARAAAGGPGVAVLLIDLDHFKLVNDTHGHLVGDDVLREVARRLAAAGRPDDLAGRFGGEEFTLLLPGASREQARQVAERVREAVGGEPVTSGALSVPVTCSIGLAVVSPGDFGSLPEVLAAADAALYEAKHTGRDRVVAAAA